MEIDFAVGAALREVRTKVGISQENLAYESGVDRTYISLIERGKRSPTFKIVSQVCRTLDISLSDFSACVEKHLD